jgi:excisionase family DNA binding protein
MATPAKEEITAPGSGVILLTPAEAGATIRCGESHIRQLIKEGKIKPTIFPGSRGRREVIRIRRAEMERYAASLERATRRSAS